MRRNVVHYVHIMLSAAVMLLISSCATLSGNGVGRVKRYTVESKRVPRGFDGFKVAFISDLHYPSLFTEKRLGKVVACLDREEPDILLLGGDYVTDNDSIDALFGALRGVKAEFGTCAVMGNHERGNRERVVAAMQREGIVLLDDASMELVKGNESMFVVGVDDSFCYDSLALSSAGKVDSEAFVILLAHTPDYAELSSTTADLVLSGHTHGGQVSLFGVYTPVRNSRYGTRFLRGRNRTSSGSTVITTNGVGTSRRKIRFCVPSEIVIVTLKSSPRE